LENLILHYFPDLSERQRSQFERLPNLYESWNQKINVISRKDVEELTVRHILHSLSIAKKFSFPSNSSVLDLGTGGGFPGIPLAILFPDARFHLVDSIGKKIHVVDEVAEAIDLTNLTSEHNRAEKVKGSFDYIVTRAVARAKQLWTWSHNKFSQHSLPDGAPDRGIICLKGGDLDEEMKELRRPYSENAISDYFQESFFETKKIIFIPR
jgi:16S rRNA (guanine527-N7)-methyltransferase